MACSGSPTTGATAATSTPPPTAGPREVKAPGIDGRRDRLDRGVPRRRPARGGGRPSGKDRELLIAVIDRDPADPDRTSRCGRPVASGPWTARPPASARPPGSAPPRSRRSSTTPAGRRSRPRSGSTGRRSPRRSRGSSRSSRSRWPRPRTRTRRPRSATPRESSTRSTATAGWIPFGGVGGDPRAVLPRLSDVHRPDRSGRCPQLTAAVRVDRRRATVDLSWTWTRSAPREPTWCWARPASGATDRGSPGAPVRVSAERTAAPHLARAVPAGLPPVWAVAAYDGRGPGRARRAQGGGPARADPARSAKRWRSRRWGCWPRSDREARTGVARPGPVAPGRRPRAGP